MFKQKQLSKIIIVAVFIITAACFYFIARIEGSEQTRFDWIRSSIRPQIYCRSGNARGEILSQSYFYKWEGKHGNGEGEKDFSPLTTEERG